MTIGMNNLGRNGRLGNQMFQYAALVGIAKQCGYDFRIPDYCDLPRGFDMLHCGDRYGLIEGDEVELQDSHEFCEELFKECPNHITLNGYFQTEKYFKDAEKLIRLDFRFKKEIEEKVDELFGEYLKQLPVSLCIRDYNDVFDYAGCANNLGNLPMKYWDKALEMLGKDRVYIICSNNVEKFKDYFKGDNFIFQDKSNEYWFEHEPELRLEKQFFDLCLISKCHDFVISNSTFSWWGAWLGRRGRHPDPNMEGIGGRVIAPVPWYGPGLSDVSTADLYPHEWEKIEWK